MLLMTGVAIRARRDLLSRLGSSKDKESPAAWKSLRIPGVDFDAHQITRLKFAMLVDRAFPGRAPCFHDENGPFGPGAGPQKLVIRHRVGEYVVEHGMA